MSRERNLIGIGKWIALALATDYAFKLSMTYGVIYTIILFIICFMGFFTYLKRTANVTSLQQLSLVMGMLYITLYLAIRFTTASIMGPVMNEFNLNSSQWSSFASYLSLGYGGVQLLTGYVLSRTGLKGIAVFAIATGLFTGLLGLQSSFLICLIIRFFMGVGCSAAIIGFCTYLTKVWKPQLFNTVLNVSMFMGIKIASIISYLCESSLNTGLIHWKQLMQALGLGGLIIGILMFVIFSKQEKEIILSSSEDTLPTSSFRSVIKKIVSFEILSLCLFSWFVVTLFYMFQTGILSYIGGIEPGYASYMLNNGSGIACLLLPFLIIIFGAELSMVILSGMQVIGVICLMLYPANSYILAFALVSVAAGSMSHSIAPIIVGERYSESGITAVLFGVLNFFAMMFGCFASQNVLGYIIDYSWKKNGSILLSGKPVYSTLEVLTTAKFTIPFLVVAFFLALYLYVKPNSNTKL